MIPDKTGHMATPTLGFLSCQIEEVYIHQLLINYYPEKASLCVGPCSYLPLFIFLIQRFEKDSLGTERA